MSTAEKTRLALEKLTSAKIKAANPKHIGNQTATEAYVRYTPGGVGGGDGKQRIIKMVDVVQDPLEPPKFKAKKVPRGPPSPPAPILRSPPRKVTAQEQRDWVSRHRAIKHADSLDDTTLRIKLEEQQGCANARLAHPTDAHAQVTRSRSTSDWPPTAAVSRMSRSTTASPRCPRRSTWPTGTRATRCGRARRCSSGSRRRRRRPRRRACASSPRGRASGSRRRRSRAGRRRRGSRRRAARRR